MVSAVAVAGLLVGLSLRPGASPAPSGMPGVSNVAAQPSLTARPSPTPAPIRTAGPNEYPPPPLPSPPLEACDLPGTLPTPADPIASPVVQSSGIAMVFTSYLYSRDAGGSLSAMDDVSNEDPAWTPADDEWEMGLWFVPPGSEEARLLVASPGGMVYPLALSAAGDTAAIWFHPSRSAARLHGCPAPSTSCPRPRAAARC